jgi:hypothetical protein
LASAVASASFLIESELQEIAIVKKFKRAIVHCGFDKTGSTAIQEFLSRAREPLLANRQLAFPPGNHQGALGSALSASPESYIYNLVRGVADRAALREEGEAYLAGLQSWMDSVPPCEAVLFSYEGFASIDMAGHVRLRSFCQEWAEDVGVVCYVRPPLSYAVSAMSQRARSGETIFSEDNPPILEYRSLLTRLSIAWGTPQIRVRRFSRDCLVNGNVVEDFLESFLHLDSDARRELPEAGVASNESLSQWGLEIGIALAGELHARNVRMSALEFNGRFGQALGRLPGERIRLSLDQAQRILALAQPHSDFVRQRFGVDLGEPLDFGVQADGERLREAERTAVFIGNFLANVFAPSQHVDFCSAEISLIRAQVDAGSVCKAGSRVRFLMDFSIAEHLEELEIGIHLRDEFGRLAFGTNSTLLANRFSQVSPGSYRMHFDMALDLPAGRYTAGFALAESSDAGLRKLAWWERLIEFVVLSPTHLQTPGYVFLPTDVALAKMSNTLHGLTEDAEGDACILEFPEEVRAGEELRAMVEVRNRSRQDWVNTLAHPILISHHWLAQGDQPSVHDAGREEWPVTRLPRGQSLRTLARLVAPAVPGRYRLQVMPVQDGHVWFHRVGFQPAERDVEILPRTE